MAIVDKQGSLYKPQKVKEGGFWVSDARLAELVAVLIYQVFAPLLRKYPFR